MEVNIEPGLNIDEQHYDKTIKVKSDIDNSDEIEEMAATITPMKKTLNSGEVCVTKYSAIERK